MKYYVYLLKDGDTVFYVGKGTGKRMYQHAAQARAAKRRSPCLCKIRKMEREGRRVISERVLLTDDAEEAFRKEVELIAQFGIDNLTNLTHGGEGARRMTTSPEHRERFARSSSSCSRRGACRTRSVLLRRCDEELRKRQLGKRTSDIFPKC